MLSTSTKKYVMEIYKLELKKGHARVSEIATAVNHSTSTASKMITKLKKDALVNFERYGTVTLTKNGLVVGKELTRNHQIIKKFFEYIGVEEEERCKEINSILFSVSTDVIIKIEQFITVHDYIKRRERNI